jgi:hypothetical protein
MAAKRVRICLLCHKSGITITFEKGTELRKHVRTRHPRTPQQVIDARSSLREYRRDMLLQAQRLRIRGTT